MSQDKLGCYRVGDLKFYSKLEAMEAHQRTGIHPHWDFNEAVFSCYDWTREPTDGITELYRRRAQQLRDQYEYIILMYSGGADSETVLQSFINNDIKLDEVCTHNTYKGSRIKTDNLNSEYFRVALPRMEYLREHYPYIKTRVIDLSDMNVEFFNEKTKFDWIHDTPMLLMPNALVKRDLVTNVREWADMIAQGKRVAVVWGAEKPRLIHENGRYSFRFIDILDITTKSMAGQQPYADELFFWTPDLPEIVIKQAHMLMRYLQQNYQQSPFVSRQSSQLAYKQKDGVKYWLDVHGVHSVIYPGWDISTYSAGKALSPILGARELWFYNMENMRPLEIWKMGVEARWKMVDDYWKNDPSNIHKGFKASWSRDYYLEKENK